MKTTAGLNLGTIFSHVNRGILLDIVVFLTNTILMIVLSSRLQVLIDQSKEKDEITSKIAMIVYTFSMCFLPPLGAALKRRGVHRRHPDIAVDFDGFFKGILIGQFLFAFLFLLAGSMSALELAETLTGKDYGDAWFLPLFFGIPVVAAAITGGVYFYFVAPRHKPLISFLDTPLAERLGDVVIFLNMILCMAFWGILMASLTQDYSSIIDRLIMMILSGLIIYFPPRIFYLAVDRERPITWITIGLANLPVLLRIFLT